MDRKLYAGIFLVALATVAYEILLTRIFSVVTWYHFAFMAISLAMFGMTAGALCVDLLPRIFTPGRTWRHLAVSAILFAISMAGALLVQIRVPFSTQQTAAARFGVIANCVAIAVPFVFSGICVCLALTRFPERTGRIYAADLAGAAIACVFVVSILRITDGPTAVLAAASLAGAGAVCLAAGARPHAPLVGIAVAASALAAFAGTHAILVRQGSPWLRLASVKGVAEGRPLYEKWNSFSRIRVREPGTENPLGWGLSPTFRGRRPVRQLILDIDGGASTVLTGFSGDPSEVEHLLYDITSLAHHLRGRARILTIGVGGGRDILAALAFGQTSIVGVEINDDIVGAVTGKFGDFTGHLDRRPGVTLVSDEARSYVARARDRFDIIQASLIDTSAATAAGAFAFTENAIYTTEAWTTFLDHLTTRGLLSFSWFYSPVRPAEMYRLTALARASLARRGLTHPRAHILVVSQRTAAQSVGTILVSPAPFSLQDLDLVEELCARLEFDLVLSPRSALDPVFARLASSDVKGISLAGIPLRLDAPTDDSPFFFNMLRPRDAWRVRAGGGGSGDPNVDAVALLGILLVVVAGLAIVCLLGPLALPARRSTLGESAPHLAYFACIGVGFMLVEISQMQRLAIFLGHPTYGLSVVLFSLLIAGGAGAYATRGLAPGRGRLRGGAVLVALVLALAAFGVLTPHVVRLFAGASTPLRILVAVVLLLPVGFLMGTAFPLGMRLANARAATLTPWLWAVNGATSVCGSVAATVIALSEGIGAAFWTGSAFYGMALAAFVWGAAPVRARPREASRVGEDVPAAQSRA